MAVGWDDDRAIASWAGPAPLDGDRTADACVIGLGGSGPAAIDALVERGLSVVGVDPGRVRRVSSIRFAGTVEQPRGDRDRY